MNQFFHYSYKNWIKAYLKRNVALNIILKSCAQKWWHFLKLTLLWWLCADGINIEYSNAESSLFMNSILIKDIDWNHETKITVISWHIQWLNHFPNINIINETFDDYYYNDFFVLILLIFSYARNWDLQQIEEIKISEK